MQELSNDLGKVVAVLLYEILCSKSQVFFPPADPVHGFLLGRRQPDFLYSLRPSN